MRKPALHSAARHLLAVLVLAVIAGCATTTAPVTGIDLTGPEREAQDYAAAGDTDAALAIYADLYERTVGAERARYAIAAAMLVLDAGDAVRARDWLRRAEEAGAPTAERAWLTALTADLALLEGDAPAALERLETLDGDLAPALLLRVLAGRGRALFALGRVEDAVSVLVERDLWLESDAQILANHDMIWRGLSAQRAVGPLVATGDPVVDGWLALLPVAVGARSDPFGLAEGLDAWFLTHPTHPAVLLLLPELRERDRLAQTYPAQIALLLPLRSQPQASAAIRDGFIAAYLSGASKETTQLRIYDTDEFGPQQAYLQAQLNGAAFVVGPLLKPDVYEVVTSAGFVPTLALNTIDMPMMLPPDFFQFGLAPEDEAVEIVHHAISNGARSAVALFPNSEWGLRLFDSFQREFVNLGGQLLESRAYDSGTQDFSLAITSLLNLNDSSQRHRRLAANLGVPIEFEPRRRQDVDIIFFAADPRAARLLAPQFRFHFAGDLPTYATSEIYDPTARTDPDLNGVIFADTPWLLAPDENILALRESLERYWPQRSARWPRLYGLGFDAYRIIPMLYNRAMGFVSLPGMSGELSVDPNGRIHRNLPLAQFVNGRPERLVPQAPAEQIMDQQILSQR